MTLGLPRSTVEERLGTYIERGEALLARASLVGDTSDYESWKSNRSQWVEVTCQGLGKLYVDSSEPADFRSTASARLRGGEWLAEYGSDADCVRAAVDLLISLKSELALGQSTPRPAGSEFAPGASEEVSRLRLEHLAAEGPPAASDAERPRRAGVEWPPESEPEHGGVRRDGFAGTDGAGEQSLPVRETVPEVELAPERPGASRPLREQEDEEIPDVELARDQRGGSALVREPSGEAEFAQPPASGFAEMPDTAAGEPHAEHLGKRVFLLHGMNEKWKQTVVRLLARAGSHEVTILHERPSEGRTLLEQAAGSGYAIVLLTADEVGAPRLVSGPEPFYRPRARQSVVFEMGLLVGVLTPRYVCVLYERGVELPSEVYGLAYILLDVAGAWQSKLLMQLRSAEFDYDVERLVAR